MAFEVAMVVTGPVAEFALSGELDASTAPRFHQELDRLTRLWEGEPPGEPAHLVLRMRDLVFMASAGVRIILLASQRLGPVLRQRLGTGLTVYLVAPQQQPLDTLRRTGVLSSVVVVEEYPPPAG